jgi:hypothetical protein
MAEELSKNFETLQLHAGEYDVWISEGGRADEKRCRTYAGQRNQLSSCSHLCNHRKLLQRNNLPTQARS